MSIVSYIRDGASGMAGGFLSNMLLHPFDLVRNRLAVSDGRLERPKYGGSSVSIVRSVVASEGVKGLYRGVAPSLIGATAAWGLYFPVYNALTDRLKQYHLKSGGVPGYQYFFAGCTAGSVVLTLTNPIWVTKTQQCLQYEEGALKGKRESMVQTLARLVRTEGLKGLYRGYTAGLLGTVHGGVQFYVWEALKREYVTDKQSHVQMLAFPALSKCIAGTLCYPQLLIRSRMQDQHRLYDSLRECIVSTWRNEGVVGFYKGLLPNLIRTVPASIITFYTYEMLRR